MRKKLTNVWLVLAFVTLLGQLGFSQVANYTFSQSSGAYSPITGGTVLGVNTNDDTNFPDLPIGFNFDYNGITHTRFSVNSNGFIAMGTAIASSYTAISTGTSDNIVAAFNYDLQGNLAPVLPATTPTEGNLRYETIGTSPNRVLVVQWTGYRSYNTTNGDDFSFQIRLYETSNLVEVRYGSFALFNARTPQAGLRGNSATDFNNRTSTTDWSATTAGATNAATITANNTIIPASGLTFTWTPPLAPAAPTTMTFTAIATSSMTVNWLDNSTGESAFRLFRSLDGISYSQIALINSTSSATTGTSYNYNDVGLSSGTLYYYRVVAINPTSSAPLDGSQSTMSGTMCGTMTIGPTGTYPTITAAIAAVQANGVNCPVIFDLQAAYLSSAEPAFPIVVPALGLSSTNTITLRPEAGATGLSVTSATATPTFRFDNASYFIIDGRPVGAGTARELTLENTSTTGNVALFQSDSRFNTITYCNVKGMNTSITSGVIVFGSAFIGGQGNSDNTISWCHVYDATGTPNNLIYSNNTSAGAFNARNTVTSCDLYNFFSAGAVSAAIRTDAGNSAWTITNNNIYQTAATRTYTTGNIHYGVFINTASGSGYNISDNYIGGTAANCGGSAMAMTGTIATRFFGIYCNGIAGAVSNIQNNVVTNINLTTSSGSTLGCILGIQTLGTNHNANISGNTIGDVSTNNALLMTTTTTGGSILGIYNTSSGTITISSNTIGGSNAVGSTATISTSVIGINTTAGTCTVSDNTVGGAGVPGNMVNHASSGTTAGVMTGIQSTFTVSSVISNNTISGLTNNYTGTSTGGLTRGINITSGLNTVTGNTIRDLSNASTGTGTGLTATVIGISNSSTTTGAAQSMSGNTIENLQNTTGTVNVSLAGIVVSNSTVSNHVVSANNIKFVYAPNNTGSPILNGIHVVGGTSIFSNNMIVLGLDAAGAALINAHEYNGFLKSTATNNNFYFNSVQVAGINVVAGTPNTYAFRRTGTGVDDFKNNIFVNIRSNAGGTATHNSIALNAATTYTADNNLFWGNGTGYQTGLVGTTGYTTLADWKAATAQDNLSISADPSFVSASDLHINNAGTSSIESKGIAAGGIVVDIDGQTRPGPTGSVNGGGTAPDLGADEFDGTPVAMDMGAFAFASPANSGCKTATETVSVTIKNFSSSTIDFAVNPVTVNCAVTGPNPQTFTAVVVNTGTLAAGATQNVVVANANYDMTAAGTYAFAASTTLTGDGASSNDNTSFTFIVAPGTASGPTSSICAGQNASLSLTGQTAGATIVWESSADGSTGWTVVSGASAANVTVTPADTTYYRAVTCGFYISNIVTVNAQVILDPTASGVTRCGAGPVTLTATNAMSSRWYDAATGGNQVGTGASITPNVTNSTIFYVANSSGTPPSSHLTTLAAGNGSSANCFAITAINTVTITGFDGHANSTTPANWAVYYRPDDYLLTAGSQNTLTGWTLLGTSTNTPSLGTGFATPIPITFNVTIPAGSTYSFQVGTTSGAGVNYTDGTAVGNVFNSTPDFQFRQGHGGTIGNCVNVPRVFNGRIHYSAGCESNRVAVPVTVNTAPAITASAANSSLCNGQSTTLSATSPNPTYNYVWSTGQTGATIPVSPTATTTYTVTATDASGGTADGCQSLGSVAVTVTTSVTINQISATPAMVCPGGSSQLNALGIGSYNATAAAYAFGASSGTYTPITGTTSTATGDDGNQGGIPIGFTFNYNGATHSTFAVNTNGSIQLSGTTFNAWTNNLNTSVDRNLIAPLWDDNNMTGGTIVYATTGTAPNRVLTVQWTGMHVSGGGSATNPTIDMQAILYEATGVIEFVYGSTSAALTATASIGISGATGNYRSVTPLLPVNTSTSSSTVENTAVSSATNFPSGTIYTFTPPVPPVLNYSWSPATFLDNTGIANPLATNVTATTVYTVTAQDISGCAVANVTVTLNTTPPPTVSVSTTNISCNGAANGSATATPSGGTAPYTYMWSNGATSATVTGLMAGFYTVSVSDVNNCSIATASATVTEPTALGWASAPIVTNVACFMGSNGAVNISPMGGTMPYSYSWSNGGTTEDLTGVMAGVYSGTLTDANGCMNNFSATVTEPTGMSLTSSVTNVTCNAGSNGAVDLSVSGGAAPYSYIWSNAATSEDLSMLMAGVYTGTVTDANGCSLPASATVTEPAALSGSILSQTNVSCNGGSNGSVDMSFSGGVAPYTYAWSNGATSEDLTGLMAGTYTGTLTDANGCTISGPISITEPTAISVTNVAITNVSCNGGSNGAIDVTVSGGTTPYTFSWSNGATSEDLTMLMAGSFTGTITDANGCVLMAGPVDVTEPTAFAVAGPTVTNVSCFGLSNGAVSVGVSGGTTPYTYLWDNGATDATITGLAAGSYAATISDANGCTFTVGPVAITQPNGALGLGGLPTISQVTCNGLCDGGVSNVVIIGGTTPYTYAWSNGATTADLTGLCAGLYTGTVTDGNGCTYSPPIPLQINEPGAITVTLAGTNPTGFGLSNGSVANTATGGTAPYTFVWSNGTTTEDLAGVAAGVYCVTVVDANGCSNSACVTLTEPAQLAVTGTVVPTSGPGVSDGSITTNVTGGVGPYTYNWSNGATTPDLTGLPTGNYSVTVTDANGNTAVFGISVIVSVEQVPSFSSVKAYPNPASTQMNVEVVLPTANELTMELYGMDGRLLATYVSQVSEQHLWTLDVSDLASGNYIVRCISNGASQYVKVQVTK